MPEGGVEPAGGEPTEPLAGGMCQRGRLMLAGGESMVGIICHKRGVEAGWWAACGWHVPEGGVGPCWWGAAASPLVGKICHRGACAWLVGSSRWKAYSGAPTGEDPPWVVPPS